MEVVAALQGFKAILDGVRAVSDTRDETRRNEAVIQLTREVIDLKMISSLQEQATLTDKVRIFEAELAALKSSSGDLQRYELKERRRWKCRLHAEAGSTRHRASPLALPELL